MPFVVGRKTSSRNRTADVSLSEVSFANLFLSEELQNGLQHAGFTSPSPIQLKAIPFGLFGSDLIAQAKAGTGKTLVFAIIALEVLERSLKQPQALVLAPTREIADQIHSVINSITTNYNPPVKCVRLIGGYSSNEDRQALAAGPQILICTPGRVLSLLSSNTLNCSNIRLFVLDEADKLLEQSFDKQINQIFDFLPVRKQIVAVSATFTAQMMNKIEVRMNKPQKVLLSEDKPSLEGVKQYYTLIENESEGESQAIQRYNVFKKKGKKLLELLTKLRFHQCLVFCNQRDLAQKLCNTLTKHGWTNRFISGAHDQAERQEAMECLRNFSLRVLVSTDLTSRGVDVERVNLVMNLDMPRDVETYMHRIGRTGRFGTYGVAVSFVTPSEHAVLCNIQKTYNSELVELPESIPAHFYAYQMGEESEQQKLVKMERNRLAQLDEEREVKKQRI